MNRSVLIVFLFLILQLAISVNVSNACCAGDDASLTEYLLKGNRTIFLCKVLKSHTDKDGHFSSEILIIEVLVGEVDSTIVTLNTGIGGSSVGGWNFPENTEWLIYTSGKGKVFGAGTICDRRSKKASDTKKFQKELEFIRTIIDIRKNKRTRKIELYYANDNRPVQGQFKKGKPSGNWKHYYENGKLKTEENYLNGVYNGEYKAYLKDGLIEKEVLYEKGEALTSDTYTYDRRNPLRNTKIDKFTSNGHLSTTKKYHNNGQLAQVYSILYAKGNIHTVYMEGNWTKYYENGQVQETGKYEKNKKVSVWETYSQDGTLTSKETYTDPITNQ